MLEKQFNEISNKNIKNEINIKGKLLNYYAIDRNSIDYSQN